MLSLLPDLLLLITGGALRRTVPAAGWQGIDKLNFHLLFPALIFVSALRSPPSSADLLVMGPGVSAGMLFACGLAWLLRGLGPAGCPPRRRRMFLRLSMGQTARGWPRSSLSQPFWDASRFRCGSYS
jgi:predicted permease